MKLSKIKKKLKKKLSKRFGPPPVVRDTWNDIFTTPERPLASRLVVGTTLRCAARCPHCILLQQNRSVFNHHTDMDTVLFEQLMKSPYICNLQSIVFSGGEALLNSKVFDWIDQAERRGIPEIELVTNGLPLKTPDIVDKLIMKESLNSFNISLDSTTAEGYCRAKGIKKTNFTLICEQIHRIANHFHNTKTKVSASFVTQELDAEDAHTIITFAQSLGLRNVQLTTYHDATGENHKTAEPNKYEYEKLMFAIDQITARTDYRANVTIQLPTVFAHKRFFCHSLANYLCVGPQGHIAPCCHMPWDAKYGDFGVATENPINHPAIVAMRKQFMQAAAASDLRRLPDQCQLCNKRTPKNILLFKAEKRQWHKKFRLNA